MSEFVALCLVFSDDLNIELGHVSDVTYFCVVWVMKRQLGTSIPQ